MNTPGKTSAAAIEDPPEGSTLEDLRDFVVKRFKEMAKEHEDFEAEVATNFARLDQKDQDMMEAVKLLEPLVPHARDINVFANVGTLINSEKMNNAIEAKAAEIEKYLEKMKADINGYAQRMENEVAGNAKNLQHVEKLEDSFQKHVDNNFRIVEQEYSKLKAVVAVMADANGQLTEAAGAMLQQEFKAMGEPLVPHAMVSLRR